MPTVLSSSLMGAASRAASRPSLDCCYWLLRPSKVKAGRQAASREGLARTRPAPLRATWWRRRSRGFHLFRRRREACGREEQQSGGGRGDVGALGANGRGPRDPPGVGRKSGRGGSGRRFRQSHRAGFTPPPTCLAAPWPPSPQPKAAPPPERKRRCPVPNPAPPQ